MKALVLLSIALVGCGGWSRPNTSEAQFYGDRVQCEQQAAQTYPPAITTSGGYQAPAQTTCRNTGLGTVQCTTQPGATTPGFQMDQNSVARSGMFDACMKSRGYSFRMR
jgi:hypothetical protein